MTKKLVKKTVKKIFYCDRCGNNAHLFGVFYFPYKKIRITVCDICWMGLALGLKLDMEHFMQVGRENFFKVN